MTEDNNNNSSSQIPAAAIKKPKGDGGFSPIWIVPIVALLIGAFLLYRMATESGPNITITFSAASGIEAGKTKIKFKGVEVGEVNDVDISEDLSGVTITAEMHPETKQHLTDKTRFWIVKPQISGGTISGLGTLLSGDYIGMDPSDDGSSTRAFVGLEKPPVIHSSEAGTHFTLRANGLGSINIGSPVFFKDIPVGQVTEYKLQDSGDIKLHIFVKEPYDKRVNSATRFWNASGFDITLNANGIEVKTESLVAIIGGGVAFDTISHLNGKAVKSISKDTVFTLYKSRSRSKQPDYREKHLIMFYFEDSVRGLIAGAPVEMRGYQVGEVLDVGLEFDRETANFRLPVVVALEPGRVNITGEAEVEDTLKQLVKQGLRAQLKTGNLLFGRLLVELDFHPDAPAAQIDFSGQYPVLPTVKGALGAILANANSLIVELRQTAKTINTLLESDDFEATVADLGDTMANLKRLTAELEKTTAPELAKVLTQAGATLSEARTMLATNSTTRTEINRLLVELAEAARSIRLLADYIEQHPESIIKGKD
jgi:paraquat-inducible protein B